MEKLEEYLDNIIRRQERLEKTILILVVSLVVSAALFLLVIYVNSNQGNSGSFPTVTISGFIVSILMTGLYVITRIHACMNGCDLIKIRLSQGGLTEAAEKAMNNTYCTKEINIKKLKLFIPNGE